LGKGHFGEKSVERFGTPEVEVTKWIIAIGFQRSMGRRSGPSVSIDPDFREKRSELHSKPSKPEVAEGAS
jgi:hypothetical protein